MYRPVGTGFVRGELNHTSTLKGWFPIKSKRHIYFFLPVVLFIQLDYFGANIFQLDGAVLVVLKVAKKDHNQSGINAKAI